jgi:hypothetical protein
MKNTHKALKLAVIIAVFAFSSAVCFGQSGGSRGFNNVKALEEYLDSQPFNSPSNPIQITMNANDLIIGKIATTLNSAGKYVSLTLSGNALTTIDSFNCRAITSIIIPNSVTSFGPQVFYGCTSLTSITFQSSIPITSFPRLDVFPGDLLEKYIAGGIGRYTRPSGSYEWTKQ